MIQLNLLPDLKKEFLKSQKVKSLVITVAILVTLGAVALSALLFVYVQFIQQVQVNFVTDSIKKKTGELRQLPDIDKYLTIQNQLGSLQKLHDERGKYSRLFEFLNVLNPSPPNNVKLSSLQVLTADKSVSLSGTTSSFETLNVFIDTLKNANVEYKTAGQTEKQSGQMFAQVLLQSSGLTKVENKSVVSFTIKAVYTDVVFDTRNEEMTVKVPSITTTPSVTNSPSAQQQNIFDSSETQ